MLDLTKWAATGKPDSYDYTVTALDKASSGTINAIKAVRGDGKETIFTQKRFSQLLEEGKLTVIDATHFSLKVDKSFDPSTRFTPVDLNA